MTRLRLLAMARQDFPDSLEGHRAAFLESLKVRNYSPSTLQHWKHTLTVFFRFLGENGIGDIREVDRQSILGFQSWLLKQGYQPWSSVAFINGVRRFFEHLEKTDAILMNPCAGLVLPKRGKTLPRAIFTEEEIKAILRAPNTQKLVGIRNRAMLEVFYSTGIRLSEMLALTVHDVDPKNGFARINKGKGGKDRVVPLGARACRWLRLYLFKVRGEWSKKCREERALWLSAQGNHPCICKNTISVFIRHCLRAAGITKKFASAHAFRHTCATHLVAHGANILHVQRLLGHSSLQSTQIYTRVAIPELSKTYARAHPRASLKARRA